MGHSYEKSKKTALRLIIFLAIVTIVEVFVSLVGKGHIIEGFHISGRILGLVMIAFSLLKAFYIVGEFMHLKYEAPGMAKTVLIPLVLLVWGIIAFLADGSSWLKNKDEMATDSRVYEKHESHDANKHDAKTKAHGHDSHGH